MFATAYKEKSAAIRYNNEYNKQAYDRVNLILPKGRKAELQARAEASGESLNGYINRMIEQGIENTTGG